MNNRPVIGITQGRAGQGRLLTVEDYLSAIWDAGGVGAVISNDEVRAEEFARVLDGFMFGGGGDISPSYYGENDFPDELLDIDSERDEFEKELFLDAFEAGKPILGICRGAQIMNVFLGGTLYPHIEGHITNAQNKEIWHNLNVLEGNSLHKCSKNDKITVNSRHKQNIKTLGRGVVACAVSDDGFIEAVEVENYPTLCLGVQFHPENYYKRDETARRIFECFVEAARSD